MTYKISAGLLFGVCAMSGQTPTSRLSFEVASVKVSEPLAAKIRAEGVSLGVHVDGGRLDMGYVSLAEIVRSAYGLKTYQVSGPDWISTERYDIHAKLPQGATQDQVPEMLQSLLAERFKLIFHREVEGKQHQVYALIVGKNGLKLKETGPDPTGAGGSVSVRTNSTGKPGEGNVVTFSKEGGGTKMPFGMLRVDRKMTMPALCDLLNRFVDRPVLDKTGLTATYQVILDIPIDAFKRAAGTVDDGKSGGDASDPSSDSAIFAGIQQLGLKLEQRRASLDILVVDHAEKVPTEN